MTVLITFYFDVLSKRCIKNFFPDKTQIACANDTPQKSPLILSAGFRADIDERRAERWLDLGQKPDDLMTQLMPFPAHAMKMYPVGKEVGMSGKTMRRVEWYLMFTT